MLWFLLVHIAAMLFWCASILYIPAVIVLHHRKDKALTAPGERGSIARFIFTNIASPAALLAITAGTVVFFINYTVEPWLIVKLSLVTALVIVHTLMGLFLLKIDENPDQPVLLKCWLLALVLLVLMATIITTVLAKPEWEVIT